MRSTEIRNQAAQRFVSNSRLWNDGLNPSRGSGGAHYARRILTDVGEIEQGELSCHQTIMVATLLIHSEQLLPVHLAQNAGFER